MPVCGRASGGHDRDREAQLDGGEVTVLQAGEKGIRKGERKRKGREGKEKKGKEKKREIKGEKGRESK